MIDKTVCDWGKMSVRNQLITDIVNLIKKQKKESHYVIGRPENPTQFVDIAIKEKLAKEYSSN